MKDCRARFEEIWPVPFGVGWNNDHGKYMVLGRSSLSSGIAAVEYQGRLETFTRCQESTSIHLGIIDELLQSLQWYVDEDEIHEGDPENVYWVDGKHKAQALCDRAKQLMEQSK